MAAGERTLDSLEVGIASVWHGVAFDRAKRLPKLDSVLPERRRKKAGRGRQQSADEQVSLMLAMFPRTEAPRE